MTNATDYTYRVANGLLFRLTPTTAEAWEETESRWLLFSEDLPTTQVARQLAEDTWYHIGLYTPSDSANGTAQIIRITPQFRMHDCLEASCEVWLQGNEWVTLHPASMHPDLALWVANEALSCL